MEEKLPVLYHKILQAMVNYDFHQVLKDMKRRYNSKYYQNLIYKIKKMIPNICIGVDVIVGFPSETMGDFMKTYDVLDKLDISYLHVFSYSERDNTESQKIKKKIKSNDIKFRRSLLQKLSKEKNKKYINKNLNSVQSVLFENHENGYAHGLTENYIRVHVKSDNNYKNKIQRVKLIKDEGHIIGQLCE